MATASLASPPRWGRADGAQMVAGALTGLAVVAACSTELVAGLVRPGGQDYAGWEGLWLLGLLSYAVVGGLVAWHRPRNVVGWLFLLGGLLAVLATLLDVLAVQALVAAPGSLPGGVWMRWGQAVLFSLTLPALPVLPLLFFPDGRLPSRRWVPALIAVVACLGTGTAASALAPGPIGETVPVDNPVGIVGPYGLRRVGELAGSLGWVLTFLVLASLVWRWYLAAGRVRRQLSWLALAALVTPLSLALDEVLARAGVDEQLLGTGLLWAPAMLAVPCAIGVAMLRDQLFDVEVVLTRALAYAILTGLVLVAYAGTLWVAARLLADSADVAVSVVATALVAVLLTSAKEQVVAGVDRLLYGPRQQPYAVLASLGSRLRDAPTPERLLTDLAVLVREALRLPYVAVETHGAGHVVALYADGCRPPPDRLASRPLLVDGQPAGRLLIGLRAGDDRFTAAELGLLDDIAGQVAVAVRSVGLADQLQRSRERLVIAREDERRRVRRELHDGVGPVLAALTLQVDSLRRHLDPGDVEATALAGRMKLELQQAVSDVRRVVEGLRPPVLDELGLAGAIREQAIALSAGAGPAVCVDVPHSMSLSPAVEVAAYRIVAEALTNVARHAHATKCEVRARADGDRLVLRVRDNGTGRAGRPDGVGIGSMRERAAELGGTLELVDGRPAGLTVSALLPNGPA